MFTLGELPDGAPVSFSSNAIVGTMNHLEIKYWVAPESVVSAHSPVAHASVIGEYGTRKIAIKSLENPTIFNCFWVEEEEMSDWRVRLFEVSLPKGYDIVTGVVLHHSVGPDKAAEMSAESSVVVGDISKMKPLEVWFGDSSSRNAALDPVMYLEQKHSILSNMASVGLSLPIAIDHSSSREEKVIAAGFIRAFLAQLVEFVTAEHRSETVRFYHACIAYYNILAESEIIIPRQVMPEVFDAAFMACKNLSGDWEINMNNLMATLNGPNHFDSSGEWGVEDIVYEYDSVDSETVAELQGLPGRFPDGIFKSYIVVIRNPELAKVMMPLEDLAEFMAEHDVPFPHEHLDKKLAYTYSTIVSWRNSAFRTWASRELNEEKGIRPSLFADDDPLLGGGYEVLE